MNRLKDETSPYLLQHSICIDAFKVAKDNDEPILLSVSYS